MRVPVADCRAWKQRLCLAKRIASCFGPGYRNRVSVLCRPRRLIYPTNTQEIDVLMRGCSLSPLVLEFDDGMELKPSKNGRETPASHGVPSFCGFPPWPWYVPIGLEWSLRPSRHVAVNAGSDGGKRANRLRDTRAAPGSLSEGCRQPSSQSSLVVKGSHWRREILPRMTINLISVKQTFPPSR